MIIKNGNVYTKDFEFKKLNIRVTDGIIDLITDEDIPSDNHEVFDAKECHIIPGLCDIHFHGSMGADFCDGTDEAISIMAKYQLDNGITSICPATMTLPLDRLIEICKIGGNHKDSSDEAELVGINLEGPFVSKIKCGAQNPDYVSKASSKFIDDVVEASNGLTKLITIAPEEDGAIECIREKSDKITFSVGHTMANFDEASKAFNNGAKHVTHLFNAMPAFTHREPGVIGAAAIRDNVMVELICDGIHIHKASIKSAFQMFGSDRVVLISDSSRACGMPEGEYELGGQKVYLRNNACWLNENTLAASATNLYQCMKNAMTMGIKVEDAIKAATYNPAKAIGIDNRCGTLEEGKQAKIVIADKEFNIVKVIK